MEHSTRQLHHAQALVQLLKTHPDLPPATSWQVWNGMLYGAIHADAKASGFDLLRAYAEALGGSIAPAPGYRTGTGHYRRHELDTAWDGVRLVVSLSYPVGGDETTPLAADREPLPVAGDGPPDMVLVPVAPAPAPAQAVTR